MARNSHYRWRNFGGISKTQQRRGALELHGRPAKKTPNVMPRDIRDYQIGTRTGTLDRRNDRWAWSPTLKLREGDVVIVRPRRPKSS